MTDLTEAVRTIRRDLCNALLDAKNEKTQREAARYKGQAFAYARSLSALAKIGPLPEGIAPKVGYDDKRGEKLAREYLGEIEALRLMGPEEAR